MGIAEQDRAKRPFSYSYYSTSELVRGATAMKLSTDERIAMLDEINRREAEAAKQEPRS